MSKRGAYLGGHTVITLRRNEIERNLALSAEEERVRKIRAQELFDKFRERNAVKIADIRQQWNEDITEHDVKRKTESTKPDPNNPNACYWKKNLGEVRPYTGGEGKKKAFTRWRKARNGKQETGYRG
jgi:hypothetical protein